MGGDGDDDNDDVNADGFCFIFQKRKRKPLPLSYLLPPLFEIKCHTHTCIFSPAQPRKKMCETVCVFSPPSFRAYCSLHLNSGVYVLAYFHFPYNQPPFPPP